MQKFLPIFPLAMVAYPGERLNLHIFEDRYKQLINECVAESKPFGLPPVDKKEVMMFGTELRIVQVVKRYEGGEMDIKVEGTDVFRVLEIVKEVPDKLYMGAIVSVQENIHDRHMPTRERLQEAIAELFALLDIDKQISPDQEKHYSYALAHLVGFDMIQEFELLKHPSESVRQRIILEHVRNLLPSIRQIAAIRERAKLNGQFRMIHPPDVS
jgi:Lon protease-like protein